MAHRWATVLGGDKASVGGQKVTGVVAFSSEGWPPRFEMPKAVGDRLRAEARPQAGLVRGVGSGQRTPGPGRGPEHSRPHRAWPDPPSARAPREWELLSRGRWRPTQES